VALKEDIRIYIDGEATQVTAEHLTGGQIRALVSPAAENVWLDIEDAQDHPVGLDERVTIRNDMRFFTDRPRTIYIDKHPYEVRTAALTLSALRALPNPPMPEDYGIWKDIPDDLDDPLDDEEIIAVANGDHFFTKPRPQHDVPVTVNRHPVVLRGPRQTGRTVKDAAISQGVRIRPDFLLSLKDGPKFKPIGDEERIHVHPHDEFRANDGDDNS
jgi:hypothetical protein